MEAIGILGRWARRLAVGLAATACSWAVAQTPFTQHGTWWNPAEPGTGFFFEAQGGQAVATFFVYADDGRPVWYSALGSLTSAGTTHQFQGDLLQFSDGPRINDPDSAPAPSAQPAGRVSIQFDGARAQVQLPARKFAAEKYATRPPVLRNGGAGAIPETGIYWDPQSSGRGFTMEVDGDMVSLGLYAFDSQSRPTWRLAVVPLQALAATVRPTIFSGGQTLAGPYKAPSSAAAPNAYDDVSLLFESPCHAAISLGGTLSLERFAFGPGPACRSAQATAPSPRKVLAPDLPGDAPLTQAQVRAAAARMAWFIDLLPLQDLQAVSMYVAGRDMPVDQGTMDCQPGTVYADREDLDGDKRFSRGDVVWFAYEGCRRPSNSGIPEYFYDGWIRSTLELQTSDTFASRMRYFWLQFFSKRDDLWFNGTVQVAAYLQYWHTSYAFQNFVIEGSTFLGPRVAVRSGTASRINVTTYFELRFDDLDTRISLDAATRLRARVRLLDRERPLLYTSDLAVMQASRQGTVVLDLEPGKADGHQIHLQPSLPDTFEVQYRRGNSVLSSQSVTRAQLSDAGRL